MALPGEGGCNSSTDGGTCSMVRPGYRRWWPRRRANNRFRRLLVETASGNRGQYPEQDDDGRSDQADLVLQGEDDRIVVQQAPMAQHQYPGDPIEQHRTDEPKDVRPRIQYPNR